MADPIQNTAQLLRAGYGIEDIALANDVPASDLRAAVLYWRHTGQLRRILGLPRPPLQKDS